MNALTSGIPRPEHRAGHFTLLGFCMIAANSAGPLIAGCLFDIVSYRTGFAILAATTAAVLAVSATLLRDLSPNLDDYS
jgi:MFS family permease